MLNTLRLHIPVEITTARLLLRCSWMENGETIFDAAHAMGETASYLIFHAGSNQYISTITCFSATL